MNNDRVAQLKAIVKERGIRGYCKLRQLELIHAFEAARLVEQKIKSLTSSFQTIPLYFFTTNTLKAFKCQHER